MKLSIITINYNNFEGLKRTFESVVNQTWQEFEYIIIDGGSSDGSAEYIDARKDKVDYWISESDKGVYNAMNKGILKATGDYLLFLNSGDHFYNNEVLERSADYLTTKDLIYFSLHIVQNENSWIRKYTDKVSFSYLVEDTLPHPATFIKANLFAKFGLFDEDLKIVSDWKFFIETICKHNATYKRIDEVLSTFYLDGLSSDPKNSELIKMEKQQVLRSGFSAYLDDITQLNILKKIISNLKKSKKVKLLFKLRILKKF